MNISQVAQRLGYADVSSFVTAFKRWTQVYASRHRWQRGGWRVGHSTRAM